MPPVRAGVTVTSRPEAEVAATAGADLLVVQGQVEITVGERVKVLGPGEAYHQAIREAVRAAGSVPGATAAGAAFGSPPPGGGAFGSPPGGPAGAGTARPSASARPMTVETIGRIRREHFIKGKGIRRIAGDLKRPQEWQARYQ